MKEEINLSKIKKRFTLQQGQSDCGVACLLSLINYYDGTGSLEKLRMLSGTTKQGTTLLGLFQVANQLGFDSEGCEADIQALIDHGKPVILHVLMEEKLQHYVVCYGFDIKKQKFIVGDPGKGVIEYSKEELNLIWKSKTCLTLSPNNAFVKKARSKTEKKDWFLSVVKEDYALIRFSIGLGILIAVLGMAMAVFSQKLIDNILPSKDMHKLIMGIILVAILLLARVCFTVLREYFLIKQTKDFNNRIIDRFFGALLQLPKPFFDTRKIGDLVARLNDAQRIQKVIKIIISNAVIDALTVLVSFGFLFYYSWQTGLISLICLPFYYLLLYRFNEQIIHAQKEVMQGYALSESNFISTMQGIATVKNTNKQSVFQKLNNLIYGHYQEKSFSLGKIHIHLSLISGIFSIVFLIAVLTYNSVLVYREFLKLGELMAIISIAGNILPSIANLALITIPINEAKVAFNRMFEFTSITEEDKGTTAIKNFNSLEVKDLSFRFAGRSQLLKSIDLKINRRECIALVGESGSGKSTLGQILQKFYTFESGEVMVNGNMPLKEVKTADWRNIIGVVPQEITIFSGTVLDNIVLAEEVDETKIIDFCQKTGFDKFITQLPQGYVTIVGEEGVNLSGGQKQIIGILRALYKMPQLLIMDEPTAAMDRNTEKFILNLLEALKGKISILLISHKLHNFKNIVDRIYVLEDGRITSEGTHTELMESVNFYSEYWNE